MFRLYQLGKLTSMEQKMEDMYKHQKNCMSEECNTMMNHNLFSEYTSELIEKYHSETNR